MIDHIMLAITIPIQGFADGSTGASLEDTSIEKYQHLCEWVNGRLISVPYIYLSLFTTQTAK